jgi:hypothetical protein
VQNKLIGAAPVESAVGESESASAVAAAAAAAVEEEDNEFDFEFTLVIIPSIALMPPMLTCLHHAAFRIYACRGEDMRDRVCTLTFFALVVLLHACAKEAASTSGSAKIHSWRRKLRCPARVARPRFFL